MSKPHKTAADYMVLAISPVLIMALVGSLCYFLIEVFYRGQMLGGVCWVMFWFIIGTVLIARIAIEKSNEAAAIYGFGLAFATWCYMVNTQPAYLIAMVLLSIVWFCAHKLVWDCTLIDEFQDSSGQGLLQKSQLLPVPPPPAKTAPGKKPGKKPSPPHAPGKWVVYFSVAALPLFGAGQMLLPAGDAASRRAGFVFLILYLTAALGLLVTTSFLGLRRYLRQRYLKMPPVIALAWLKFGLGVAVIVLVGAVFLPRPGANAAWSELRYQIDYQIARASKYATAPNAPGQGEGRAGRDTGGKQEEARKASPEQGKKPAAGKDKPGQNALVPKPAPMTPPGASGSIYNLLRAAFWVAVALAIGTWIIRRRHMLLEMLRSVIAALKEFFLKLFDMLPKRKTAQPVMTAPARPRYNGFSQYANPFFATGANAWPPEEIMIYTYEAVQVWAREQGLAARPELTAREFCQELGKQHSDLAAQLSQLARLYGYAAYGRQWPPNSNLEPIRELWRRLPVITRATA